MRWQHLLVLIVLAANPQAGNAQPNRPGYLDDFDPYYPHRKFPKLITPQWVGEEGVEAVVILAIDDMRDPRRYEAFLRPILRRLQRIDGRAPVSIMSCAVEPTDPQLQSWLKEGLSIECHTVDHPCPFFKGGFDKAKGTYDRCVDLMHAIPNSKPVAFRMPCCDSLNTPSPRFWAEIFNKTTAKGNFLTIDSSVFNVFTSDDPELPKELVKDDRFKKYLPADRSFVNTIENYPYPYVIGKLCWEFPYMTPSDWQAQHLHKPCNPQTVEDWKAALDSTVIKQGVFCMVFHPHGWIKNDQVIEFIDHTVAKHGKKVTFLAFKEAQERLDKSMFEGKGLRALRHLPEAKVQITDHDQHIGIIVYRYEGDFQYGTARSWNSSKKPGFWQSRSHKSPAARWDKARPLDAVPVRDQAMIPMAGDQSITIGIRLKKAGVTSRWECRGDKSEKFELPAGANLAEVNRIDGAWRFDDAGLRFVDLDGDGNPDVIFSNEKEYGIYLFKDMKDGWSRKVMAGKAGDKDALPMISRNGTNNGFWVHSGSLWWSNEDTVLLKDHVDRRSIKELLERAR
jgi:hypothetical protein